MRLMVILVPTALLFAGCVSTSQMQVAPNAYQLETNAGGLLFMGTAGAQTLQRAAELTIAKGYTHFRLVGAGLETGASIVGISPGRTYGQASVVGNTIYGSSYSTPATVIRGPTERASATVVMFQSSDPEAQGAFDAEQVIKESAS